MEGPRPKGVESTKRHVTARPHAPSTAQQQQQQDPLIYKPISLPPWKPKDTRKRKPMIYMDLQQRSSMFKIRALVQQLRPNFIEVGFISYARFLTHQWCNQLCYGFIKFCYLLYGFLCVTLAFVLFWSFFFICVEPICMFIGLCFAAQKTLALIMNGC